MPQIAGAGGNGGFYLFSFGFTFRVEMALPQELTGGGLQWDFKADVVDDFHRNINRKVKLGIAWYNPF